MCGDKTITLRNYWFHINLSYESYSNAPTYLLQYVIDDLYKIFVRMWSKIIKLLTRILLHTHNQQLMNTMNFQQFYMFLHVLIFFNSDEICVCTLCLESWREKKTWLYTTLEIFIGSQFSARLSIHLSRPFYNFFVHVSRDRVEVSCWNWYPMSKSTDSKSTEP